MTKPEEHILNVVDMDDSDKLYLKKPVTCENIISHHDAHPYVLAKLLNKVWGPEWLDWDGDILEVELRREFRKTASKNTLQKIRAVRALFNTVGYWVYWPHFLWISKALNNCMVDFENMQRLNIGEILVSIDIASLIDNKMDFSDEVKRYQAASFHYENVNYCPPPLDYLQELVSKPYYHCPDCDTIYEFSKDFPYCDYCSGRYEDGYPLNNKPSKEGLARLRSGEGVNLNVFYKFPYAKIKARFDDIIDLNEVTLEEDVKEDVQCSKLLVAFDYAIMRRKQLKDQIKSVLGVKNDH